MSFVFGVERESLLLVLVVGCCCCLLDSESEYTGSFVKRSWMMSVLFLSDFYFFLLRLEDTQSRSRLQNCTVASCFLT